MEEEPRPVLAKLLHRFDSVTPSTRLNTVDFPRNVTTSPEGPYGLLGSQRVYKPLHVSDIPESSRTSPLSNGKSPVPGSAHSRSQSVASNHKLEQLLSRLDTRHVPSTELYETRPIPTDGKVKVLLKKLRDKDQLISDLEAKLSKSIEDSKLRDSQITEYKLIIEEYDFKFQGLLDKTNASLERLMVQKNTEIAKLKEDLASNVENERNKIFAIRKEYKGKLAEMEKELEKQSQFARLLQEENKKLMDDYAAAQNELSRIKQKLNDSHFLSSADYRMLETHFQDMENTQNALKEENDQLRQVLDEKTREAAQLASKTSIACNAISKTRLDIGQLSRALRIIRQTPTISALTVLLALKKEAYQACEGSAYEQLTQGLELLGREVKDLEATLVEWCSEANGKACLVS